MKGGAFLCGLNAVILVLLLLEFIGCVSLVPSQDHDGWSMRWPYMTVCLSYEHANVLNTMKSKLVHDFIHVRTIQHNLKNYIFLACKVDTEP